MATSFSWLMASHEPAAVLLAGPWEGGRERWCPGEREKKKSGSPERVKDGEETDVKIREGSGRMKGGKGCTWGEGRWREEWGRGTEGWGGRRQTW